MIRIYKNKRGFTLVEMILVIAIIVILASVMTIDIAGYLNNANSVKAKVNSNNSSFISKNKDINSNFIDLGY